MNDDFSCFFVQTFITQQCKLFSISFAKSMFGNNLMQCNIEDVPGCGNSQLQCTTDGRRISFEVLRLDAVCPRAPLCIARLRKSPCVQGHLSSRKAVT